LVRAAIIKKLNIFAPSCIPCKERFVYFLLMGTRESSCCQFRMRLISMRNSEESPKFLMFRPKRHLSCDLDHTYKLIHPCLFKEKFLEEKLNGIHKRITRQSNLNSCFDKRRSRHARPFLIGIQFTVSKIFCIHILKNCLEYPSLSVKIPVPARAVSKLLSIALEGESDLRHQESESHDSQV
jgi:hypothetical protein